MGRTASNVNKKGKSQPIIPIHGEYANYASVNNSELQTIIDFGFIQPNVEGKEVSGVITKRIILPPKVAKQLGEILSNAFKNVIEKKKTKK